MKPKRSMWLNRTVEKMNRMKFLKLILFFFISFLSILSCKESTNNVVKTEPIAFKKEGNLTIRKQKVDTLITSFDIEIAESEYETQTGLMYREQMALNQGMLFIFPDERIHSFYMKNTEIPLDLIFIKADSTIASFQENTEPYNEAGISSQVPIKYVLEINAGLAQKWLLEIGDKIEFSKD